jgi:apolipoprotein D and lipocalin family protein
MADVAEKDLSGAALDAEIRRVEQALIDREERFVRSAHALGDRVHAAIPRSLGGGAAAGLGLGLLSWLFRPSPRARPAGGGGGGGASTAGGLARWFAMLWPFVPTTFRARIDPRMLSLFTALGIPLIERLLARRRAPPRTEPYVDLHRYAGPWYEVARLPESQEADAAQDVTVDYVPLDRHRLAVVHRCTAPDGALKEDVGLAEQARGGHGAKLRVNYAGPLVRGLGFAWSDYWILRVDRYYETALVGTPDRRRLWLLSRTPEIEPETYRRMVDYARVEGYDTERVRMTRQSIAEAVDHEEQLHAAERAAARAQARAERAERAARRERERHANEA